MEVAIPYKGIYGSWNNFYNCMQSQFIDSGKINYFMEICNMLPPQRKVVCERMISKYFTANQKITLSEQIFSIVKKESKIIVRILGIKMTFKRGCK